MISMVSPGPLHATCGIVKVGWAGATKLLIKVPLLENLATLRPFGFDTDAFKLSIKKIPSGMAWAATATVARAREKAVFFMGALNFELN
jgi:hypothetical protein